MEARSRLSRQLGDAWAGQQDNGSRTGSLAILSNTTNFLLNPLHPDAERIQIIESTPWSLIRVF